MNIGIIGTNPRAKAIGSLLARGGGTVTFSDPSDPARGQEPVYDQTVDSDVLVVATSQAELEKVALQIGRVGNAVVVCAVRREAPVHDSVAEHLALLLESRRVVSAMAETPTPGAQVRLCGDDPLAKQTVMELLEAAGCTPVDVGPLSHAAEIETDNHLAA
jgi:predicted dinucleotide-binding enzyme